MRAVARIMALARQYDIAIEKPLFELDKTNCDDLKIKCG